MIVTVKVMLSSKTSLAGKIETMAFGESAGITPQ